MKTVDIMEMLTIAIEEKLFKEWKHEGLIEGFSSEHINFDVDDKEYVLLIREIGDGEHFSEMHITRERDYNGS
jgi:hypothetical protein